MTAAEVEPRPEPGRGRRAFHWLSLFLVLAIPVVLVTWLAVPKPTCACSPTPSPPPRSPVEGVVVAVDSSGLGRVAGFTLRIAGGSTIELELGALENPTAFPPTHLAEHLASSQPVRAFFNAESSRLVVYRLEDATAGSSASP